jgi:hypothetical protein
LTVAVAGSGVYLAWRAIERHRLNVQVRNFISSLENRTGQELEERAAQLKAQPKVARYVLPEIRQSLRGAASEQQMCAAIQISRPFVDDGKVGKVLFRLRRDPRESVAAAAVEALSRMSPGEAAAATLGACLEETGGEPPAAAVVDEVCDGLVRLGAPGLEEMKKRKGLLSADRRVWLVRYVSETSCRDREGWLEMLRGDDDAAVKAAAAEALLRADAEGGERLSVAPR